MATFDSRAQSPQFHIDRRLDPTADSGKEFIFRLRNGFEVARAKTLSEFAAKIKTIPIESVEYHFYGKHFSPWLRYLKLDQLADSIERLHSRGEQLRQDISDTITRFWT